MGLESDSRQEVGKGEYEVPVRVGESIELFEDYGVKFLILILIFYTALLSYLWQQLRRTQARLERVDFSPRRELEPSEILPSHFLFNSLNTIRYFVRTNGEQARQLLLDLASALQSHLRKDGVTNLREELDSGRAYLRLEQARLGERLQIMDEIPSSMGDQVIPSQIMPHLLRCLVEAATSTRQGGSVVLKSFEQSLVFEADGIAVLPIQLEPQLGVSLTVTYPDKERTKIDWSLVS